MTDEVALWKQRILQRKANGQTIIEWCREHNVTKGSYYYWRRQVIKAEGSATEHTTNIEPVIFAKLDRAEILAPALRVTWQDVTIHLSNTQEARLATELIVSLCRPC